jgi:hypothetical protein
MGPVALVKASSMGNNGLVPNDHTNLGVAIDLSIDRRPERMSMSSRTRSNRLRKPGAASVHRPARFDRRIEHRRVRRAAQVELRTLAEPEDHALPLPVNTSRKSDPLDRPEPKVERRRFKVWKTKGWKRRSIERAQRAQAYRQLVKGL